MTRKSASLITCLIIAAAFAIAGDVKTVVITNSTFSLDIPDHQFLRIYNFTQQNNSISVTQRGVVIAAAATPTATPAPTPTPTPTPTGTPTPTPTPTPPPRAVVTAAIADSGSPPEFIKQVVVDGPAHITVDPVSGATLVLTYQKIAEPTPTPTPTSTAAATATATSTPTPSPMAATIIGSTVLTDDVPDTSTDTPTPAPTATRSATSVPTPTPTPSPSPTPSSSPSSTPPATL